eukprot:g7005.t1
MSTEWTIARLSVGEINAVITAISVVVSYCMSLMLGSVALEIRRLMIIRGKRDAIIQDEKYKSMWRLFSSRVKRLTIFAALPVLLNRAASTLIEFTTSGVSASVAYVRGAEVRVLGLVEAEEITDEMSFISTEDSEGDTVFNVVEEGVFVFGNQFETRDEVSIDFCVEVHEVTEVGEDDGVDAIARAACREGLLVDQISKEFVVVYKEDVTVEAAPGSATMTRIIFVPTLAVLGIEYVPEVKQGSRAAALLASMTAEIFSGTARLFSRQQLVDVLGAVVRLESMDRSLQTAYGPVKVVEIGVSAWVPVVLLLALLLPAMAWGLVKWHTRGTKMFLPVSPAEWSACAARELSKRSEEDGSLLLGTAEPLDEHYGKVYAFGPVEGADEMRFVGQHQQRLGWVKREAVTPAITEKDSPARSLHVLRGGSESARVA